METVIIFAVCYLIGVLFGAFLKAADYKRKESPAIGYMQFNLDDPAKEFLELHITRDLDVDNPPEYVRLLVLVSNKEGGKSDGSISR